MFLRVWIKLAIIDDEDIKTMTPVCVCVCVCVCVYMYMFTMITDPPLMTHEVSTHTCIVEVLLVHPKSNRHYLEYIEWMKDLFNEQNMVGLYWYVNGVWTVLG